MHVGKYQLVSKLATGGMAEVYLAKSAGPMGFEKTLVLKRILPHLAEDEQFVEMFLGEAKLAAQLEHPNIVQIFDFGEAEGAYYLAMEYIDGPNLRTLSKRARAAGVALPPAACAKIIASACEGLAFAHDFMDPATGEPLGLIHRDISPDNILLSRQGAVKVVDFGIAKAANQSHKTQTGLIKGKIAYMPPEQLQARPLDRRVDVYALGVVLYELLTGHKPFDATTDVSMMQAVLFEPFVPAVTRRPELPRPLMDILDKALSKVREHRYADCRAFQTELERFVLSAGEPVGAYQLSRLVAQVSSSEASGQGAPPASGSGPKSRPGSGTRQASTEPTAAPPPRSSGGTRVAEREVEPTTPLAEADESRPTVVSSSMPAAASSRRIGLIAGLGGLAVGSGVVLLRGNDAAPPAPIVITSGPSRPVAKPATATPPAQGESRETPPRQDPGAQTAAAQTQPEPTPPPASAPAPAPEEVKPVVAVVDPPTPPKKPSRKESRSSSGATSVRRTTVEKARLEFRIRPYATVLLDGKPLGQTPLPPAEVEVGSHTVQLINKDLGKEITRTVEVKAGQTNVFKYNLLED
ncbi:protein kinase domain-containing protein [Archangium sp.]|uniref:protein kinase domain-containing protein n=1 Tax=Archangium sp. TaxID=1872627 RepID=UPI00286C689B|nr:protein kinase [Archangium sp.]